MRFKDKSVIVTGAGNGIGAACARAFAAEGARVIVADVDAAAGGAVAAEIGGAARFVRCDVGARAEVEALVQAAVAAQGGLDILINNAGIIHTAGFLDISEADFDRVIRVNLKGAFLMGQAAARQMAAQGRGGAIVNMSSVNAVLAIPDQIPYVVSKGGVNQLTKVMAMALVDKNIRVNAIGPGTIATELARKAVMTSDAARKKIMARTPMGRLGEPEEIARVALFLAGDDSSYMTGQTIYPDGGRLALNYTMPVD